MNGDWEILGIAPTNDVAEIRRAYSKALRAHRPDTDPVGFQRLREAYERRLEIARSGGGSSWSPPPFLQGDVSGLEKWEDAKEQPEQPIDVGQELRPQDASVDSARQKSTAGWEVELPPADDSTDPSEMPPPTSDDERMLLAWDALWSDPVARGDRGQWVRFLSGDGWWNWEARRLLEAQILSDVLTAWAKEEWRSVHEDAWYLMDRHFGWWNRERELSMRFSAGFIDELFGRIQRGGVRNGSLEYPSTPRAPLARTTGIPLTDHRSSEEDSPRWRFGGFGIWGMLSMLLILVRACHMLATDDEPKARHYTPSPFMNVRAPFDSILLPSDKPEVPLPIVQTIWYDAAGGLLPNTCAAALDSSGRCAGQDRVQVLFKGPKSDFKLILTRGWTPIETLSLALTEGDWVRLCSQKGKDVLSLRHGTDPCHSKAVKAWAYRKGHLKSVPVAGLDCDSAICNGYLERMEWGK